MSKNFLKEDSQKMNHSINLELVQNKGRPAYLRTQKLSSHIEEIDQTKYPDVKCVKVPGEIFVSLFYIRKDNDEVQELLDSRTKRDNFNGRILGYLDPFEDRPKKQLKGTEEYPCKRVEGVLRWKVNNREIFYEVYDPSRVTQSKIINKFKLIKNVLPGRRVTVERKIAHSVKWEKTEEYDLKELEELEQLEESKEQEEVDESESEESELEESQRLEEQEQLEGWEFLKDIKQLEEPKKL